ncbi:MAG: hypothetical protein KAW12_12910 [Candidatus Aminicenantes bacterium]|nr:hypothetical protein [Candidatus Aminicenantes bacterium]
MKKQQLIYIASSWKNQHAVEMMTDLLEAKGHKVLSFVREAVETVGRESLTFTGKGFDAWVESPGGQEKFIYDTCSARVANVVVYIGPSGADAWAEVGVAYGERVTILGLWSKGEAIGLNRRMVQWFRDYRELLAKVDEIAEKSKAKR